MRPPAAAAATTAAVAGTGLIDGFPMVWAQNIKDVYELNRLAFAHPEDVPTIDVIPLFEQYAAPLRLMLGPRSETLARQLKTFDFDGALLTLRQCVEADEPPTDVISPLPDGPSLPRAR